MKDQLAAIQEKFFMLVEEPLIKAREAAAERQRLEQAIPIPLVAQGYEAIYRRFLKGMLIYRPQEGSDNGKIELPIAALANPLEGTFDLSGCGNAGQYLSIATGYKKRQITENANKLEIWLAPKFLIGRELNTTASHFKDIYENWNEANAVEIFWTWGGWDNLNWYDYVITQPMDVLSNKNLYEKWHQRWRHAPTLPMSTFISTSLTYTS